MRCSSFFTIAFSTTLCSVLLHCANGVPLSPSSEAAPNPLAATSASAPSQPESTAVFCGLGTYEQEHVCYPDRADKKHMYESEKAYASVASAAQNLRIRGTAGSNSVAACDSATTDCDGDGWTVMQGDCCDKPGPCGQTPGLQNPGAVEYVGDGVDNNCNGLIDEIAEPCDFELASTSKENADYARALDLCQFTAEHVPIEQRKWGVISAAWATADRKQTPDPRQYAVRGPKFGDAIYPVRGGALMVISSGVAADPHDTDANPPAWGLGESFTNISTEFGTSGMFPEDWLEANHHKLPTGCSDQGTEANANDSVMLTLRVRVPTNAQSFSFKAFFLSSEFPEFLCKQYNDLFLTLIRNESGTPSSPNPPDGNIAFFQTGAGSSLKKFPVGINLAGDALAQRLFSVCDAARANPCSTAPVPLECARGVHLLKGTGYERDDAYGCTIGGGTDWLTVAGNVVPGQIAELRILVADVGDHRFDSTVLLDGFAWNATPAAPGTQ